IELYGGEKIIYSGERAEGDLATVSTKIITKNGTEVPVDYRLFKKGDRWMIYDVNIEGISLVSNYRTQFNKIIQTNRYNALVERIKTNKTESAEGRRGKRKAQQWRVRRRAGPPRGAGAASLLPLTPSPVGPRRSRPRLRRLAPVGPRPHRRLECRARPRLAR